MTLTVSIHLRVPAALLREIDRAAARRGATRTRVMLDAARKALRLKEKPVNVFDGEK